MVHHRANEAAETPAAIWTLDARDSVMLEVIAKLDNLSDDEMQREILAAHKLTIDFLAAKGVDYSRLRTALVPQQQREEIALIFDTQQIQSDWYGYDVGSKLVGLLPRKLSCSLLHGDLIIENQHFGMALIDEFMVPVNDASIQHTTQLYCVYINNLTKLMLDSIVKTLAEYSPFVGYVNVTNSSQFKDWLSATLVSACLKARHIVVTGHEDDAPIEGDYNLLGWPWEEHNYTCRSIPDMYAHLFLAYKIERRVVPGFEADARFALAAIAGTSVDLEALQVDVKEARLEYLRSSHASGLDRAGLMNADTAELASLAKSKIADSYFYKLEIDPHDGASKFNTVFELANPSTKKITRLVGAFVFKHESRTIELVTLH